MTFIQIIKPKYFKRRPNFEIVRNTKKPNDHRDHLINNF